MVVEARWGVTAQCSPQKLQKCHSLQGCSMSWTESSPQWEEAPVWPSVQELTKTKDGVHQQDDLEEEWEVVWEPSARRMQNLKKQQQAKTISSGTSYNEMFWYGMWGASSDVPWQFQWGVLAVLTRACRRRRYGLQAASSCSRYYTACPSVSRLSSSSSVGHPCSAEASRCNLQHQLWGICSQQKVKPVTIRHRPQDSIVQSKDYNTMNAPTKVRSPSDTTRSKFIGKAIMPRQVQAI